MFTQTNDTIVWRYVRQSRLHLLSYLETLTEVQWNTESLCDGWKVRDVVAHLILIHRYEFKGSTQDFLRSGLRFNTFLKRTAIKLGREHTTELLRLFAGTIDDQQHASLVSPLNVLADLLVHEQDIRLPLNHQKMMDTDALDLIFTHWEPRRFNIGERLSGISTRLKGIQLVIVDLNISIGTGYQVVGSAQDILLIMLGRYDAFGRLSGEGLPILHSRVR